jgi:hypothetical protein
VVDRCVRLHEDLVQLPSKEQGIGSPDILDDRVENVQRWQLLGRRNLQFELAAVMTWAMEHEESERRRTKAYRTGIGDIIFGLPS